MSITAITPNPDTRPDFEPVITLAEAAQLLKRPEKTLIYLAQSGRFPAFKIGKCWRTRKSLLDRWINEQLESQREKSASAHEGEKR